MTTDLKGVNLQDSFVLGWQQRADSLEFIIDFSLWPESPDYRRPKENEWTCYRRGFLQFDSVTAVDGLKDESKVRASVDANGEKDFGNIESFEQMTGLVKLTGDFGAVHVHCGSWKLLLTD